MLGLADAVRPINSLGFDGRVPPRVEEVNVFSGSQVQSQAAGLKADQKYRTIRIGLKPFNFGSTIAGPSIKIFIDNTSPAPAVREQSPGS